MLNLFITISGLVIIINIIYSVVPDDRYTRYCKIIVGTITTLAVINIFSGISEVNFNDEIEQNITYSYKNNESVFDNMVNENIETNIKNTLIASFGDIIRKVETVYNSDGIEFITIEVTNNAPVEAIKNKAALYCDINSEKVVVKYT